MRRQSAFTGGAPCQVNQDSGPRVTRPFTGMTTQLRAAIPIVENKCDSVCRSWSSPCPLGPATDPDKFAHGASVAGGLKARDGWRMANKHAEPLGRNPIQTRRNRRHCLHQWCFRLSENARPLPCRGTTTHAMLSHQQPEGERSSV
jgi:hypothetical protein